MDLNSSPVAARLLELLAVIEGASLTVCAERLNAGAASETIPSSTISSALLRLKSSGYVDVDVVRAVARDGFRREMRQYHITGRGLLILASYQRAIRAKNAALLSGSLGYYEMLVS
jgi:hypothetical protein